MNSPIALAVHGGAGVIAVQPADEAPYHAALQEALRSGHAVLSAGGTAIDAVQAAIVCLEDCPLFNAGRGSVYTSAGRQEMDAGLMDGRTQDVGAVASVYAVRNPILLARQVLDDPTCVLLAAEGAQARADELGFERLPPGYFDSPERRAQLAWAQSQGQRQVALDHDLASSRGVAPLDERSKMGTVGAVALDRHGQLAAGCSTGGMTNKRPGRVGDSAVPGAGFYANNSTCAVAATGTGEHFLRGAICFDIHARMRYLGESLAQAADTVISGALTDLGGRGGVIAIGRDGQVVWPFNSAGMYRGRVLEDGVPLTAIYR